MTSACSPKTGFSQENRGHSNTRENNENKMERRVPMRHEKYWTEETDRATWSRKIISHVGRPKRREKPEEKNN